MELLNKTKDDILQNMSKNLNKQESAYYELIKILKEMPKSEYKIRLSKAIFNYTQIKIEYISELELDLFMISKIFTKLKERYELDQMLFDHIFSGKVEV